MAKFIGIMMVIVLTALFSYVLGISSSWVLTYFGFHIPWYVCSVAIFLIGLIFKRNK